MCDDTLADRLRKARERAKLSQRQVGDRLGITSQSVSNWESGRDKPARERVFDLAAIYRVSPAWIVTGAGSIENEEGTSSGVALRSQRGRLVPRVDMQTAVMERFSKQNHTQEVHTYFDCGPETFVMDIVDHSNAPEYRPGDAVAIDPGETPVPGDMVLAVLKPDERGAFRRYQLRTNPDGSKYVELTALNPDWDREILRSEADGRIIGVMTEHVKPRR